MSGQLETVTTKPLAHTIKRAQEGADEQAHARIVAEALGRILPDRPDAERFLFAHMMVGLLSSCLRVAAQQPSDGARGALNVCRPSIPTPAPPASF